MSALLVLVMSGIGIGIGYSLSRLTSQGTTPATTTPTTSPAVGAVAAKVDPGLVDVNTTLSYQTARGAGTGMVVTANGEVITNNHVIEGETSLHVTDIGDAKTYTATVVGYDVSADVAVLQITGASHLHTVSFAASPAKVGQSVVAIGNATGKGGTPSAVSGKVTGLGRSVTASDELSGRVEHLTGMIETNAPIVAGDSGGPLVNSAGQVLGMDTAGSSRFSFSQQTTTQGFSIPGATVRLVGTEIELAESSSTVHVGPTAFLGVDVAGYGTSGAVVIAVLQGTSATSIGISPGDTIVSVGGEIIRNPTTLADVLQIEQPGKTVSVGWQDRFGTPYSATVTLRSGPPA